MTSCLYIIPIVLLVVAAIDAKAQPIPVQAINLEDAIVMRKFEESAKRGDPTAMYQLAKRGQSESMRKEWLKKAASKEYGPAILELALDEETQSNDRNLTREVQEDHRRNYHKEIKRSFEGMLIWAKTGDVESMYRIGAYADTYAREGLSTVRECLPWLEKAALQGHKEAPFDLALILIKMDTPTEKTKGFEWLKRSTQIGSSRARAAIELVRHYTYGFPEIALKRDSKEARKWAKIGAELEGSSVDEFLLENGLENPDKVESGEILFQ